MSFEKTARKLGGDDADVTWRGSLFQTCAVAIRKVWSLTVNSGLSVMMTTLSEDDLKPRCPKTGQTCQQVKIALSHANISTSGQRA